MMLSSRSEGPGTEIVVLLLVDRFSILCRKTKHQSNHSNQSQMTQWQCSEPIKTPSKCSTCSRRKARETCLSESPLVM